MDVRKVIVDRLRPKPKPRIASNPYCFGTGSTVSGSVDKRALPTSMKMLARFNVQNVLFFLAEAAPPNAEPTAVLPIRGKSTTPDPIASLRLTSCARSGMLMITSSMTNPVSRVLLLARGISVTDLVALYALPAYKNPANMTLSASSRKGS